MGYLTKTVVMILLIISLCATTFQDASVKEKEDNGICIYEGEQFHPYETPFYDAAVVDFTVQEADDFVQESVIKSNNIVWSEDLWNVLKAVTAVQLITCGITIGILLTILVKRWREEQMMLHMIERDAVRLLRNMNGTVMSS